MKTEGPPYNVPIPDPSSLTTEAIRHEITWLREIMDEKLVAIRGLHDVLEARLGRTDLDIKATFDHANEVSEGRRNIMEQEVAGLRELLNQSIASNDKAVRAALDSLNALLERMDQRIDDVKTSVSALEGNRRGTAETIGWVIGSVGVIIAIVTAALMAVHLLR